MAFRDAWKSVEGTSTEDAQKAYVDALVKVRLIVGNITGSYRGGASEHNSFVFVPAYCSRQSSEYRVCGRNADGIGR
jgi:hypothetical protein